MYSCDSKTTTLVDSNDSSPRSTFSVCPVVLATQGRVADVSWIVMELLEAEEVVAFKARMLLSSPKIQVGLPY